jgi:hypothetical protein
VRKEIKVSLGCIRRPWLKKKKGQNKSNKQARNWWLTPIILATQEAESRRIKFQSQPEANSSRDPISKISNTKKGWRTGSSSRVPV